MASPDRPGPRASVARRRSPQADAGPWAGPGAGTAKPSRRDRHPLRRLLVAAGGVAPTIPTILRIPVAFAVLGSPRAAGDDERVDNQHRVRRPASAGAPGRRLLGQV